MRLFRLTFAKKRRAETTGELDRAISAWRGAGPVAERLSERSRSLILARMRRREAEPSAVFAPLFLPTRRLALGAALPIVVLTLLLGTVMRPSPGRGTAGRAPRVEAIKDAGEIVFVIANGSSRHRVTRSSAPDGASEGAITTTAGSFRVRIDEGSDVVFYRID